VLADRQLFVDDYLVFTASGARRFLAPPIEHPTPLFPCDGHDSCGFVGSVNHNGTHFLMHYRLRKGHREPEGHRWKRFGAQIGLATSVDGLNWARESTFGLDRLNSGGEQCVLYDPTDPHPKRRYKMTFNCMYLTASSGHDNLCMAFSPDGIHWHHHGTRVRTLRADTQSCLLHDHNDTYEIMIREEFPTVEFHRAIRGMAVLSTSVEDFNRAFRPGSRGMRFTKRNRMYYGRYGTLEMYRRQYYALTRTQYAGVYFGFLHLYEWPYPQFGCPHSHKFGPPCNVPLWDALKGNVSHPDTVLPYLLTSRDGAKFNHEWVYAEMPWQLGQLPTDGFVMPANQMITMNGYHYVYFSRNPGQHFARWDHADEIRLARFQQDRMVGVERVPSADVARLMTHSFEIPPDARRIVINVHIPVDSSFELVIHRSEDGSSYKSLLWEEPCEEVSAPLHAVKVDGEKSQAVQLELRLRGGTQLFAFRFLP